MYRPLAFKQYPYVTDIGRFFKKHSYRHPETTGRIPGPVRPWFPGADCNNRAWAYTARSAPVHRLLQTGQRHWSNSIHHACVNNKRAESKSLNSILQNIIYIYIWNIVLGQYEQCTPNSKYVGCFTAHKYCVSVESILNAPLPAKCLMLMLFSSTSCWLKIQSVA